MFVVVVVVVVVVVYRVIDLQAVDGDLESGPVSTILIMFDHNCTVLRDSDGNDISVLTLPNSDLVPDLSRLELCTAIGIERIEIVNAPSLTSLSFMRNVEVGWFDASHVGT